MPIRFSNGIATNDHMVYNIRTVKWTLLQQCINSRSEQYLECFSEITSSASAISSLLHDRCRQ